MSENKLKTLDDWMNYAQSVHFRSIDMSLERVRDVYQNLNADLTDSVIIIVGGTNGKGSSVAMLESIYRQAGYTTAAFTSPHLVKFNERYRINSQQMSDQQLISSFAKVEQVRGNIPLTYFEFATLVAIDCFSLNKPQVMIMETGMGGRLDSVNILDPDCVILTHVALDHTQWLGDTREQIGFEKAGLFRENIPVICGDHSPPDSVLEQAQKIGANFKLINRDFNYTRKDQTWNWQGLDESYQEYMNLPLPAINGKGQFKNAAGVLMAVYSLNPVVPVEESAIRSGLEKTEISGRLDQTRIDGRCVVFDVAHNTDAVSLLNDFLNEQPSTGRTIAVFGMLVDKDIQQVISIIELNIDQWELASLNEERGTLAEDLGQQLLQVNRSVKYNCNPSPVAAFKAALENASSDDRIVVFGSFHTVGDVLGYINS